MMWKDIFEDYIQMAVGIPIVFILMLPILGPLSYGLLTDEARASFWEKGFMWHAEFLGLLWLGWAVFCIPLCIMRNF